MIDTDHHFTLSMYVPVILFLTGLFYSTKIYCWSKSVFIIIREICQTLWFSKFCFNLRPRDKRYIKFKHSHWLLLQWIHFSKFWQYKKNCMIPAKIAYFRTVVWHLSIKKLIIISIIKCPWNILFLMTLAYIRFSTHQIFPC